MLAEGFFLFGGLVQSLQAGRHKVVAALFPLCPCRLKLVAEVHQLLNLRDDSVLLGEWWEGNKSASSFPFVMC